MRKRLETIQSECQNETTLMHQLYQKRMQLEALVRQFENDNEGYNNIRKVAEEKVNDTLAGRKELLRLAIFCVIESIRKDPDKYGPLIYYNDGTTKTSTISASSKTEYYNGQCYPSSHTYRRGQQEYYISK